jgi:lipopolysaccharide transport system permease protein
VKFSSTQGTEKNVQELENRMTMSEADKIRGRVIEIRSQKGFFNLELGVVWQYRELLFFLAWRELKVRYKQAVIGAGWAVIQPVFAVLIFTAVFGYFAKMPSDGIPYPVFAFTALLPWTYFAEALRRSGTGLVGDSELIRKIYFPRLIIPIAMVLTPAVDFVISFCVLLVMLAVYGIIPSWHVVFLPMFLFVAMLLALAVGLWLGPINVRYRDVMHTLPFLIQVWMYASPIVYPLSIVPERWKTIYCLNPMVGVIEGFRWAILGKGELDISMGLSASCVLAVLLGGGIFFRKMERSFADVI